MFSLVLHCRDSERELLSAELYGLGTMGIVERDLPAGACELEGYFEERFDARAFARHAPEWCERGPSDAAWVDTFEPFAVGERLYLAPAWRDDPAPPGRLRLAVHARQASGSGYQPATQLALVALERWLHPGDRFLDVGTGSGILSAAAELLGAGVRFACDVDVEALIEARENATPAALFAGSARAARSSSMDLIVANVNAEALVSLRDDLIRALAPGGRMILSGFTARNTDRLVEAFVPLAPLAPAGESGRWRSLALAAR